MGGFLDNFLGDKPDWLKIAILQEENEQEENEQEEESIKEKEEQMKKNQKQD